MTGSNVPVILVFSEHCFHYLAIKNTTKMTLIFKLCKIKATSPDRQHICHPHLSVNNWLHRRQHRGVCPSERFVLEYLCGGFYHTDLASFSSVLVTFHTSWTCGRTIPEALNFPWTTDSCLKQLKLELHWFEEHTLLLVSSFPSPHVPRGALRSLNRWTRITGSLNWRLPSEIIMILLMYFIYLHATSFYYKHQRQNQQFQDAGCAQSLCSV